MKTKNQIIEEKNKIISDNNNYINELLSENRKLSRKITTLEADKNFLKNYYENEPKKFITVNNSIIRKEDISYIEHTEKEVTIVFKNDKILPFEFEKKKDSQELFDKLNKEMLK